MTSKYHNQSSRRFPLKRVRPENENQGSISSKNRRANKKFCRQSSEDSAFVEIEKSSDERAFDLFHKEYFIQFRPYFKTRSIVTQFIEHLWSNMIESSKVSFIKKILKNQGNSDVSSIHSNENESLSNDENDSQINKSFNETNRNISTFNENYKNNKYNRSFLNDLLSYLRHWETPRFVDQCSSLKPIPSIRRSSRIRRAPIKCVCPTCISTCSMEEHLTTKSILNNDSQQKHFRQLIDFYHQLDDQYGHISNSSSIVNDKDQVKFNDTNDCQIEMSLSKVIEHQTELISSPPIIPMLSTISDDIPIPSFDFSIDSSTVPNDKIPFILPNSLETPENPPRRTFVILTELDEPFFGPYPIEFTITI